MVERNSFERRKKEEKVIRSFSLGQIRIFVLKLVFGSFCKGRRTKGTAYFPSVGIFPAGIAVTNE